MNNSNLENLLFNEYEVQIKFTSSVTFPFFHGQKLNHLFCKALGVHPLGENIIIFPPEIGRIKYTEGEFYNFGFTIFGKTDTILDRIKKGLQSESEKESEENQFRGNYKLLSINKIPKQKYFFPYEKNKVFTIQFITPLRVQRKNPVKGKKFFSPFHFEADRFLELLRNRIMRLSSITEDEITTEENIPEIHLLKKTLIWVDVPYSKTLGGVIGKVVLQGELNEYWQKILWLGQFIQAGNLTSFGFGKYALLQKDANPDLVKPAATFLHKILDAENLIEAVHHIKLSSEKESYGRKRITEYESNLLANLNKLVNKVKQNKYKPGKLTGIILPKGNSKIRALAIPPLEDKILQRATTQIISTSIEQLLEESSFAYRKGFSRQAAARTISKAQKEGYKYVFKADINSFFDNVDWEILFEKLDVLFFNEPVLELLKKWIVQPVEFNGKVITRTKGLPQGLSISPLLANLFLDEFDEALQDEFKLIRFADDFLILCKSTEELKKAKEKADNYLEKINLEFKDEKTEETSFDIGFHYLGYLFVKSLIVEKEKKSVKLVGRRKTKTKLEIPKGSWLNSVELDKIKSIEEFTKPEHYKTQLLHPHLREEHKIPIYISNPQLSVYLNDQSLIIQNKTDKNYNEKRIPISKILFLVFIGRARITLPSIIRLRDNGVPSFFLRANGKLYLSIHTEAINYSLWQKQTELFYNNEFSLKISKIIIAAQIHNYKIIAGRNLNKHNSFSEKLAQLSALEKAVKISENIDELRGYEGKSAAVFYSIVKDVVPSKWNFVNRTKHPPEDSINVMLSLGFTILYNHIATVLQIVGLNPEIGFYHKHKSHHFALASDLVEEFRFIVISYVLYIVHRNIITPDDFNVKHGSKYPCVMKYEARNKFISSLESRLDETFTYNGNEEGVTYKHYFYLKAKRIKDMLNRPEEKYQPLRTK